ncbi:ABC transporter ATP-binding protein [Halomonas piscis]|uniref:ABC transporter ATP-binding protein n=1 Tax=Halomonas piscis TaxID=3031727 RepID=A0ABY9YXQ7_9GAMM|nr:ABC transporter ATP-binding protein [Halomonas piscis]WNK19537.1 ABC transporter ATP-binding protein [Halomonas piscis]
MTGVIDFHEVTHRHGALTRLDSLSFSASQGEVLALLGHNGAGKTTTMHLILGLLTPTSGRVSVLGGTPDSRHAAALRQRLGYLPENVSFYEALTGVEVLTYFARLKRADRGQVTPLLEKVGLGHAAHRRVKTYSKGMRQRLGLAQALLGEPGLLLLDEPTTGLDPAATRDFYVTLDELRGRGGTVVLSSHILPGVEPYIDRALILGNGRRLALGNMETLRREAALPLVIRVRGRLADSDWQALSNQPGHTLLARDDAGATLAVPEAAKLDTLRRLTGTAGVIDLGVEPPTLEHLYQHFSRGAHQ